MTYFLHGPDDSNDYFNTSCDEKVPLNLKQLLMCGIGSLDKDQNGSPRENDCANTVHGHDSVDKNVKKAAILNDPG